MSHKIIIKDIVHSGNHSFNVENSIINFCSKNKNFNINEIKIKSYIVQQSPHKRIVEYLNNNYYINIPYNLIFNIVVIEYKGSYYYPPDLALSFYSKVGVALKPVKTLDSNVNIYSMIYPHVGPTNMLICQYSIPTTNNINDYIDNFINCFWSAENNFYMNNNFDEFDSDTLILDKNNSIPIPHKIGYEHEDFVSLYEDEYYSYKEKQDEYKDLDEYKRFVKKNSVKKLKQFIDIAVSGDM